MPKKRMTIDDLALMTQREFVRQGERSDRLEEKIDKLAGAITQLAKAMQDGFQSVNARLDLIRQDILDLPRMREELGELRQRVERLEARASARK